MQSDKTLKDLSINQFMPPAGQKACTDLIAAKKYIAELEKLLEEKNEA